MICRDYSLPPDSFLEAVGPPGSSAANVAKACLEACEQGRWRSSYELPPYVAYLALFVLAAGQDEGDLPDNAYYKRLTRLLGLPDGQQFPGFSRLGDEVWSDLEDWSTTDMDGNLGIFKVRIQGAHRHVGIPRSQTLLWDEELKALPSVFAASAIDPIDQPSDTAIANALLKPPRVVRLPTQRTLLRPADDVMRRALLEVVRDELSEWDGTAINEDAPDNPIKRITGAIRVCIKLSPIRRSKVSTLRISLAAPFPEEELELYEPDGKIDFTCREFAAPWSTQLLILGNIADATDLDWESGVTLTSHSGYEARMRGSPIRVFESGEFHHLTGWVEVSRIDRSREYLIACTDGLYRDLLQWAQSSCGKTEVVDSVGLVPESWRLVRVDAIHDDEWISGIVPALAFPTATRIRLVGGVKSGRGFKYYEFAPPQIQIVSSEESFKLTVDDQAVEVTGSREVELPRGLPVGKRLVVRVHCNGAQLASQSLVLVEQVDWRDEELSQVRVDRFGDPGEIPGFCGAYSDPSLGGNVSDLHSRDFANPANSLILIGRRPGEIARWPTDRWPAWDPVWAIEHAEGAKSRRVTYCGNSPEAEAPLMGDRIGRRKRVQLWKININNRRRRIIQPSIPRLASLWGQYVEVASVL